MNTILRDRTLLDLIERVEGVRAHLEQLMSPAADPMHFPMLADNALRMVIDYLVELRDERHAEAQRRREP